MLFNPNKTCTTAWLLTADLPSLSSLAEDPQGDISHLIVHARCLNMEQRVKKIHEFHMRNEVERENLFLRTGFSLVWQAMYFLYFSNVSPPYL